MTNIGLGAFSDCTNLANITIGSGVTSIGEAAFSGSTNLMRVYFKGKAPKEGPDMFDGVHYATVYYLPGTTGWGTSFGGRPAVLWNPQMQTSALFRVLSDEFGFTIAGTTNIPIVVEASASLAPAIWTALQTCTLTNGSLDFSDPAWTNYPARF